MEPGSCCYPFCKDSNLLLGGPLTPAMPSLASVLPLSDASPCWSHLISFPCLALACPPPWDSQPVWVFAFHDSPQAIYLSSRWFIPPAFLLPGISSCPLATCLLYVTVPYLSSASPPGSSHLFPAGLVPQLSSYLEVPDFPRHLQLPLGTMPLVHNCTLFFLCQPSRLFPFILLVWSPSFPHTLRFQIFSGIPSCPLAHASCRQNVPCLPSTQL
jgi:hypothetical protein